VSRLDHILNLRPAVRTSAYSILVHIFVRATGRTAPLVGTLAAACRSLFVNLSNMWGVRRQRDHDNQERRCLGSIGTGAFAWTRDITINGSTTKGGWFSLRIHMN